MGNTKNTNGQGKLPFNGDLIFHWDPTVWNILDAHSLVSRTTLASKLGLTHDDKRNIYTALGYDLTLTYDGFASLYTRNAIAKAVINRPIDMTWQGELCLSEGDDSEETPLEKEYKTLSKELGIKSKFKRLDKLSALGQFGLLLLGFDDVRKNSDFAQPVKAGKRNLLYLKPRGQGQIQIEKWVDNVNDRRYGMPEIYKIDLSHPTFGDFAGHTQNDYIMVHYSRVLHVTGERLENEVQGTPMLEPIWNNLKDLEKITGGSAEMFWLGARPGYHINIGDGAELNQADLDNLQTQIDEWENNLRRFLQTANTDVNALASQVSDPSKHMDVQLQAISAQTGIPKRILTGSERGELSSGQDRTEWLEKIQLRREEFAEDQIIRPFVEICQKYGILPDSDDYSVAWSDLFAPSEKDKAEVGRTRAEALKAYGSIPGLQDIVPIEQFAKLFLGLSDEDVEKIQAAMEEMETDEQREAALETPQPPNLDDNE